MGWNICEHETDLLRYHLLIFSFFFLFFSLIAMECVWIVFIESTTVIRVFLLSKIEYID